MAWIRVLGVVALIGCNVNEYRLGGNSAGDDGGMTGGEGGTTGDGGMTGDGGGGDAMEPCTIPQQEKCNAKDDDCDGAIDEGFILANDPANCGACGNRCEEATGTMVGSCAGGSCSFACLPGRVDLDANIPGCEYSCTPTNGGNETCDFADNDCDGKTDENIDTITDVDNCGGCGRICTVLNATAECRDVDSDGDGDCTYSTCDPGFADLILAVPGCEYTCPIFPTNTETCNFIDDDCDGKTDEGTLPGVGGNCTDPGFESKGDTGHCEFGHTACVSGSLVCQGYVGPLPNAPGGKENACNNEDDDCDGNTDEGYVLANDVRNCGACGNDCTIPGRIPNAIPACVSGTCTYSACLPGFTDTDFTTDGCDYQCTKTGDVDVCDGVDNDCDRAFDEDVVLPQNFCRKKGACANAQAVCDFDPCAGRTHIFCDYGSGVEIDPSTCDVASQEDLCDAVDNDCDGATDETFPAKNSSCDDGDIGECKRVGKLACNTAHNGLTCDFTGSPPDKQPQAELCNGKDDDCDGVLDNDAPDDTVAIKDAGNNVLFRIYRYEASRPDATVSAIGTQSHRACSNPNVIPWSSIGQTQAEQACEDASQHGTCSVTVATKCLVNTDCPGSETCIGAKRRRLCTADEWELACAGLAGLAYPYGNTYDPLTCNGNDYDDNCTPPDNDVALPTGHANGCPTKPAQSGCVSVFGAFDMSGNLKEWTSTDVGNGSFSVRGGGFDTAAGGMTCQFDFVSVAPDFLFPNLGFRCCEDP